MIVPKQPQTNINHSSIMPPKIHAQALASTRPAMEYFPLRDKNATPTTLPHTTFNKNAAPKTPSHMTFKKPRVGSTPNRSECAQESVDKDKDDAKNFKELDKEDASEASPLTSQNFEQPVFMPDQILRSKKVVILGTFPQ